MKAVDWHVGTGTIPIKMEVHDQTTLIECCQAEAFLEQLFPGALEFSISSDMVVRGAVIPGEGAFFELRDSFGLAMADVLRLDCETVQSLLLDSIW